MFIGYARVSTDDQNVDLQVDALKRAGCERIFIDAGVSGSLISRPALNEALSAAAPGDTLVTWRIDRLGRSLGHLISLIEALQGRKVEFISLSDAIDTSTAGGRLQFHVLGALAEFERSLISERTKAGMSSAKARGVVLGRPPRLSAYEAESVAINAQKLPLAVQASELGVSVSTIRRLRKSRSKSKMHRS